MVTLRPMISGGDQVMDADPEWLLTGRAKGRSVMSRTTGEDVSLSFANEHPAPVTVRPTRRVVVTAFGSLGDLHPYLAIALGLKSRGHEVVLVTSALLPPEGRGAGSRLPGHAARLHLRGRPRRDAAGDGRPHRPGARPAAGDPAGRAGVLRGHPGGGRGGRPAGLPPDLLRRGARRRGDGHPLGLDDGHAAGPVLGL